VAGSLADHIGREVSAIIACGISTIGVIAALFITSADQIWLLWIHACFFGLTWGARGPMITAKTADLFQGRHLGAILGVISIGTGIGAAVGAWASRLILISRAAIAWRSCRTWRGVWPSGSCAVRRWLGAESGADAGASLHHCACTRAGGCHVPAPGGRIDGGVSFGQ